MKYKNTLIGITALLFFGAIGCDTAILNQNNLSDESESMLPTEFSEGEMATVAETNKTIEGEYLLLFKSNRLPNGFSDDIEAKGGKIIYQHDSGFAYVSELSEDAAATLQVRKDVSELTANTAFSLNLPNAPELSSEEAAVSSTQNPAGSFFYARQWHYPAIGADEAWAAGLLGSEDVTVAILDGGIDYTNLDLAGLVDLSRSISFVPSDDALVDFYFPGRNYITDLQYHGTHVAATVASNGILGAGITSKTTLTGVKVCDINGDCNFGAIFSGLLYTSETGVDVVNMSLGGGFTKAGNGQFVGFINSLMNTVRSAGVTVVVSAGNDAADLDKDGNIYSAFCDSPNVICVSATGPIARESVNGPFTEVDAPATYTNFGRSSIDVAAPGGNTGAPVWATCSQTSLVIPVCQTGNYIVGISGTSMASPHVSGLAALIISQGTNNPAQVKSALLQSADDLGQNGTDKFYGKGRINVANALGL
ncbi:MAG: S8 family serine peptidase [Gracilimonas sp.]|uniref:S8 family serine peptidase n=1 Tax=Gracilimonas sp. TaxID=1974203 RepID=UPI003752EC79|nr:S8 family serine peptidase [Gracilimonas sp.]